MGQKRANVSVEDTPVTRCLLAAQAELYSFIYMMTGNRHATEDILQDTNVIILRHAAEYDRERDFMPWAKAFAYNRVRTFIKKEMRCPLIFNEDLMDALAEATMADASAELRGDVFVFLDECLEKLAPAQKDLVKARYYRMESVKALARRLRRTEIAVHVQVHRIRRLLGRCIQEKMNASGTGVRGDRRQATGGSPPSGNRPGRSRSFTTGARATSRCRRACRAPCA